MSLQPPRTHKIIDAVHDRHVWEEDVDVENPDELSYRDRHFGVFTRSRQAVGKDGNQKIHEQNSDVHRKNEVTQIENGVVYDIVLPEIDRVQHRQVKVVRRSRERRKIVHAALIRVDREEEHELTRVQRDEEREDEDEKYKIEHQLTDEDDRLSQAGHRLREQQAAPDDKQGEEDPQHVHRHKHFASISQIR